ncbi:putative nuclease, RNAse H fold [Halalkaliarchaeum sp. AArc-CO]|uniref:DUF429 domain-containing protein n=1 Tax=unclassified Halalkaliarchaeum TaxID=2678344 RepID=UPI00217E31CE|nr:MULTISPECIES: DUF429 domain-containing protein [unclassified Halalkaliarchaeum]MDR5674332.1 DUF429 domain-containing protein [Halalkaliarchaeum sp. AArc-GB]UWG50756.1 putative nuclease, RNAse H fold [Halalkaliarchaeum sp. AArc-CO]
MYLGVDGCPDGWIAVAYDDHGYADSGLYSHIEDLYGKYGVDAETILVDVPIGLRERSNAKRPCDVAARKLLSPDRHSSVFAPPIRAAVHADSYEEAKRIQEEHTDGSLGVQTWGIADGIAQVDRFLREMRPEAVGVVREAHPEVAFWALAGEEATRYSKTGQPAAAFVERVDRLEAIDPEVMSHLRAAGTDLGAEVGLDDLADAFALAVTASPLTGDLRTLPGDRSGVDSDDQSGPDGPGDPAGLPMEMVYARP